jgi:hypothetical protein
VFATGFDTAMPLDQPFPCVVGCIATRFATMYAPKKITAPEKANNAVKMCARKSIHQW